MNSSEMQRAQVWGITYRSDDYKFVVVLVGDKAIKKMSDGTSFSAESVISIEDAWAFIARRGLKKVG